MSTAWTPLLSEEGWVKAGVVGRKKYLNLINKEYHQWISTTPPYGHPSSERRGVWLHIAFQRP